MLNPDTLVERAKLRTQVSMWRLYTFAALGLLALVALGGSLIDMEALKKPYIARISIDNVIFEDQDRLDILKEIEEDDKIKAVIMRINSPGGTAVGGESLYKAIASINSKKPVVAVMDSLAASAAYMVSLGAERSFAQNGTITGSIGVIMEIPNLKEAGDKLGVRFDYIKTSPLKGSPNLFEAKNEEALVALDEMMRDFYHYFVGLVSKERKLSFEQTAKLADGRVYSGKKAADLGLVDEVGGEEEAVKWLVKNKNISADLKIEKVELSYPKEPFEEFLGSLSENLGIKSLTDNVFNFKGLLL